MRIGVLALQGDFREHIDVVKKLNVDTIEVRAAPELNNVDGLIIPGGESTTMVRLMKETGLDKALVEKVRFGMAVWGTCAGAIVLATKVKNAPVQSLGLLDILIERNSYGRQVDSFSEKISIDGIGELTGIFIRSPKILDVGKNVVVTSRLKGDIIAVQQGRILATTFHPELSESTAVHKYFLGIVEKK